MPTQQNLNVSPYYDDFDPNKNYYKTLFKPGTALQARELSGLQSSVSDQIEQLAGKFLSPGDAVTPGEYAFANPVAYVKVRSLNGNISDYVGYTLSGVTSSVTAKVMHVTEETETDSVTFFVSYASSGTSNDTVTFLEGETLASDSPLGLTAIVGVTNVDKPVTTPAMGSGCLFSVTNGSYFINGYMVRNYGQTIVVSKYTTNPSYQIGFIVTESFVSSNEDSSLLDNSQGSSNFAAPGADRLKIDLTLEKLDIEATIPNFIHLVTVIQGNSQGAPKQTIKWDWLYDILAKRTYNESGDYIVKDFTIQPMEYVNSNELDGLFNVDGDGTYPPIPASGNVDVLSSEEAESNYVLNVSAGLAYVQGYEVGFDTSLYKFGKKARTTGFRDNAAINITDGSFFYVSKVYGAPDIQNITSNGSAIALGSITLYSNFTDGHTGEALVGETQIPQNLGNAPQTTYHVTCDSAVGQTQYNEIYKGGTSVVVSGSNLQINRGDIIGDARVLYSVSIPALPSGIAIPKYFQPTNIVGTGTFYEYNSEYKLGYTKIQYFTYLPITLDNQTGTDWIVGDVVFGEDSGAIGIVEQNVLQEELGYSVLILSNVSGEFLPGESVSQGTKSAVIFMEGEISGLVFTNAGPQGEQFDLEDETSIDLTSLGNTVNLSVADGEIVATETQITLTAAGRRKVFSVPTNNGDITPRRLNYTVKTNPSEIEGYAIIPSIAIKNSSATTKSFHSSLFGVNDFSADISGENSSHIESVVLTSGGTFSGRANSNFIISDNYSGDSSKELKFGDIISFVDDIGTPITKQVLFATEPSGYGSLRTPAYVYFTTTLVNDVAGKQVVRIRSKKFGNSSDNLIYELPQRVIKTLESAPSSTDIRYQAFREFYFVYNGGSTSISLTTTDPNEQFVVGNNTTITVAENRTNILQYIDGRFISPTNAVTQDDGKRIIFTIAPIPDSLLLKIITPVSITNVKAKQKILVKNENGTIDTRILIPEALAKKSIISLGRTDVFNLVSVVTATGVDVTDNYIFDNGQRDDIYDISRLILKSNRPAATTELRITCDSFDHSTDGDFFSVDSYTHDRGVSYKNIPVYATSSAIPDQQQSETSGIVELRDCVDFRPSVNTGNTSPSRIPGVSAVNSLNARNFRNSTLGGNADVPRFMVPGTLFQCDIEYYLARVDSVFLERSGELRLTQGVPDLNPKAPADESISIRLYDLSLPPYTFSAEDIHVSKYNYHRYTMKDISSLDRRIQRIEEHVSLSSLEQSALNTQVRDAVTGLDRFKNGFVVDAFKDHANGNTISPEYRCSIDPDFTHLRAPHFTEQVTLEEINQLNSQRISNAYQKTGPLFTVPYTNVEFIKNPFATRSTNLQPFSVFVYNGEVQLEPSIDTWQEVRRRDRLVIEQGALHSATTNTTEIHVQMGLGFLWGRTIRGRGRKGSGGHWVRGWGARHVVGFTYAEAARRGLDPRWVWGFGRSGRPKKLGKGVAAGTTTTTTTTNSDSSTAVETSQGDRVVDTEIAKTMRTIPVSFNAHRLKPKTRYYAFFDGVDINAWVSPDEPETIPEDNTVRFVAAPNTNPKGFGQSIISDDAGAVVGVFLVPNGHAPIAGSIFDGDLNAVEYDTTSVVRNFNVGARSFRLTTSATNGEEVDAYGETEFTSSGIILDKQETVISTRPAPATPAPPVVTSRTYKYPFSWARHWRRARYYGHRWLPFWADPIAQSFTVDDSNPDGVFVTELDVFFKTKDDVENVVAYLVTTEAKIPTENVIPFTTVEKNPDSILRVTCTLGIENQITLLKGTVVVGKTSGARGVIKSTVDFNNSNLDPIRNTANTVYNLILDNYLNEFIPGETIVPELTPATQSSFAIIDDEISISRVDVRNLGTGYTYATVIFSPPQLPGGVNATASAVISKGKIVKIFITNFGSGYTQIPTVAIGGDGSGGAAIVKIHACRPAVTMGVAISEDASAPTKFKFQAPVYLLGNTTYAFVLKSPNSIEYKAYISKLGENVIGTDTRVAQQPLSGSIFRSQDGGLWTEDQNEDIKFTLLRADFSTNTTAIINLENAPLGLEIMDVDPIETNATPGPDSVNETYEFGNNSRIVKAFKKTHGLHVGDYAYIEGVDGYGQNNTINGIPVSEINGLQEVLSCNFNDFTFRVNTEATASGRAGGNKAVCSYNRPFEVITVSSGSLLFQNTTNAVNIRSAGCISINGNGKTPYVLDSPVDVPVEASYYYNDPKQCAHYTNEIKYSGNAFLQNRRSLNVSLNLTTSDSKISPVFDYDRTNAVLVHSIIDDPTESDIKYGAPTVIITCDGSAANDIVDGLTISTDDVLIIPAGKIIVDSWNDVTRKLKVRGQHAKSIAVGTILRDSLNDILPISVVGVSNVTYPYFIPETQQDGSVFAKWISREFKLENPSDGLEVKITGIMYERNSIRLYYRPIDEEFEANQTGASWIPFNGTGLCNNNDQIKIRSSDIVDPEELSANDWTEFSWSAQGISQFSGFSLKIVLSATNVAKVPLLDDFRVIASE